MRNTNWWLWKLQFDVGENYTKWLGRDVLSSRSSTRVLDLIEMTISRKDQWNRHWPCDAASWDNLEDDAVAVEGGLACVCVCVCACIGGEAAGSGEDDRCRVTCDASSDHPNTHGPPPPSLPLFSDFDPPHCWHTFLSSWWVCGCVSGCSAGGRRDTSRCIPSTCSLLGCVAVCCGVLQRGTVCRSVLQCGAVRCSVAQCVAVIAVWHSALQWLQCGAVRCSAVQCGAVWCSVVQFGAMWCSLLP